MRAAEPRARRRAPRMLLPRLARAHSVVSPSVQRDATTRVSSEHAASGVHSPVASSPACSRWTGSIARSSSLSRSFQPTQAPKTFSHTSMPTPFSQALCSSSTCDRFQRRVWWSMCRCSNQRARSTPGNGAVAEPLRPGEMVVAHPRQRQRRLALERDAGPRRVDAPRGGPGAPPSSCRGRRRRRRALPPAVRDRLLVLDRLSRRVPTSHGL